MEGSIIHKPACFLLYKYPRSDLRHEDFENIFAFADQIVVFCNHGCNLLATAKLKRSDFCKVASKVISGYGWPNVAKFKNKNIDHIQGYKSHSTIDFTFNAFNHDHIQGPFSQPRNKITFNKIFHIQETKIVFNNHDHIQGFFFCLQLFFCQQFFLSTTLFDVNNFFLLSTNPMMLLGKQRLSTGRPSQKSSPSLSKWRRPKAQSSIRSNSTWTALMTP